MKKPIIAIPMGDPAGIGPEIVLRAVLDSEVQAVANCLVVGDHSVLQQAIKACGLDPVIHLVQSVRGIQWSGEAIQLMDLENIDGSTLEMGIVQATCGQAAYDYIRRSIELAMRGEVDAVSTPPINKEALRAAGIPFIGHTEIFASLTGAKDPLTMFEVAGMRAFFLSRHVSLRKACEMVTEDRIVDYVRRCTAALKQLGVKEGVMAIAGLNPHSGEHGLFGDEEGRHIEPAIQRLRGEGYNVIGPVSADSVYHFALRGKYNSVLSLYHDQGHIATKTYDFERTISVTNGMPILRTSVDHGTAFDIAGTGRASSVSMVEAILVAAKYAPFFPGKN